MLHAEIAAKQGWLSAAREAALGILAILRPLLHFLVGWLLLKGKRNLETYKWCKQRWKATALASLYQAFSNSFLKYPVIKHHCWFTQTPQRITWRDSSLLDWSYPYISRFRKQITYLCLFQWWRLQFFQFVVDFSMPSCDKGGYPEELLQHFTLLLLTVFLSPFLPPFHIIQGALAACSWEPACSTCTPSREGQSCFPWHLNRSSSHSDALNC